MKAIQVALAIGIAVLLPLLAEMSVRFYAEPPKYDRYYDSYSQEPKTDEERKKANADMRRRQDELEKATAAFNLQVFYLAFPLGVIEVLVGVLLRRRPTLAAGIVFGGLSTIACGSYSSWETLPGWSRYASLLFALLLLAVLALAIDRRSRDEQGISAS